MQIHSACAKNVRQFGTQKCSTKFIFNHLLMQRTKLLQIGGSALLNDSPRVPFGKNFLLFWPKLSGTGNTIYIRERHVQTTTKTSIAWSETTNYLFPPSRYLSVLIVGPSQYWGSHDHSAYTQYTRKEYFSARWVKFCMYFKFNKGPLQTL